MALWVSGGGSIRQSEGTDYADYGHFSRRQTWSNSSNLIICQWAMSLHHCANFRIHFGWTDWSNHSGGGGMLTGTAANGYGTPGSLSERNMHYDYHSFHLNQSGNTIRLRCSGGNSAGPGNVYIGVSTTRADVFSWGS